MQDAGVRGDPASGIDDRRERRYATAIDALLWQAGDHRCTAAELRRKAADRAAEAARWQAAAEECDRAADQLGFGNGQGTEGERTEDPAASVDLLRSLAEDHRADAQEALAFGTDLGS